MSVYMTVCPFEAIMSLLHRNMSLISIHPHHLSISYIDDEFMMDDVQVYIYRVVNSTVALPWEGREAPIGAHLQDVWHAF